MADGREQTRSGPGKIGADEIRRYLLHGSAAAALTWHGGGLGRPPENAPGSPPRPPDVSVVPRGQPRPFRLPAARGSRLAWPYEGPIYGKRHSVVVMESMISPWH